MRAGTLKSLFIDRNITIQNNSTVPVGLNIILQSLETKSTTENPSIEDQHKYNLYKALTQIFNNIVLIYNILGLINNENGEPRQYGFIDGLAARYKI